MGGCVFTQVGRGGDIDTVCHHSIYINVSGKAIDKLDKMTKQKFVFFLTTKRYSLNRIDSRIKKKIQYCNNALMLIDLQHCLPWPEYTQRC